MNIKVIASLFLLQLVPRGQEFMFTVFIFCLFWCRFLDAGLFGPKVLIHNIAKFSHGAVRVFPPITYQKACF